MIKQAKNNQRGFLALVAIVVIGATALILSLNASLLGLGALDFGYLIGAARAGALADGCVEEALERLRLDQNYLGQPAPGLPLLTGSCIIEVVNSGGQQRVVTVTGQLAAFTKTVVVTVGLGERTVEVRRWSEPAE